jgi:hypothetical protein
MALKSSIRTGQHTLTPVQERRISRHMATLERLLVHEGESLAEVVVSDHPDHRQVQVHLRVQLGRSGWSVLSTTNATTADAAVRLAVGDVRRQLEKHLAVRRGEPSFGVPSRREPRRSAGRRTSSDYLLPLHGEGQHLNPPAQDRDACLS